MVLGYFLALLIGLSLGLLGGGGSILTVPILVYVLDMAPKTSIALSLAIVGTTSFIGAITHFKKGNINLKVAAVFGPVAMLGAFLGAKISAHMAGSTQLIAFAVIMLLASISMFKSREDTQAIKKQLNYFLISLQAIVVGIVTGIVGVGGGFLIVPALVILTGISMKQAVGTSLLIIALNSISGFVGYIDQVIIPWKFLITFTSLTSVGIILGGFLISYIPSKLLKKFFAVFLIVMGIFILYKNKDVISDTRRGVTPDTFNIIKKYS